VVTAAEARAAAAAALGLAGCGTVWVLLYQVTPFAALAPLAVMIVVIRPIPSCRSRRRAAGPRGRCGTRPWWTVR
jgi:hypothetical protein